MGATSGNGKTITKPFTAHQGGYFSFVLSADTPYDAGMFDFNTQPMPMEDITFTLSNNWIREDTSKDDPTGIIAINDLGTKQGNVREGWFTLSGTQLSTNTTKRGIYIHQRKKVVN
jgi:hypothetical protein